MLYQCSQWYKLRPIIYVMLNLPCLCHEISKQGIYNYLVFRGILRTYVHYSERIVWFRQKLGIKCICIYALGNYHNYYNYCPYYIHYIHELPLVATSYITIDTIVTIGYYCYYHYTVTSNYYISLLRLCCIVVSCCSCIHCVISWRNNSLLLIALRLQSC